MASCQALVMEKQTHHAMKEQLLWDDQRIILETRNGNRDSFGIIVDRYRSQALRIAASIVGDIELARDLTQDAFIKAYRSLGTFDLNAPFTPWFYQILRNVCLDNIRKRTRFSKMLDRFKKRVDTHGDLMAEIQRDDLAMMVRTTIQSLKPKDREILELKHYAGLNYDEISAALKIPKGTVMSRLYYARLALKEKLTQKMDCISGVVS